MVASSGGLVKLQTPLASLVILMVPPVAAWGVAIQSPVSVTSEAWGARTRNVTLRSAWISGDASVSCAPLPAPRPAAAGGAWAAPNRVRPYSSPTSAIVKRIFPRIFAFLRALLRQRHVAGDGSGSIGSSKTQRRREWGFCCSGQGHARHRRRLSAARRGRIGIGPEINRGRRRDRIRNYLAGLGGSDTCWVLVSDLCVRVHFILDSGSHALGADDALQGHVGVDCRVCSWLVRKRGFCLGAQARSSTPASDCQYRCGIALSGPGNCDTCDATLHRRAAAHGYIQRVRDEPRTCAGCSNIRRFRRRSCRVDTCLHLLFPAKHAVGLPFGRSILDASFRTCTLLDLRNERVHPEHPAPQEDYGF